MLWRLSKFIARCGVSSRREAAKWIQEGRVRVGGSVVMENIMVKEADDIVVDGLALSIPKTCLYAYHKPRGEICSRSGRDTIYDTIESRYKVPSNLLYAGRLDVNSEGLLLLSNSGDLCDYLTHPSLEMVKRYRVFAWGKVRRRWFVDG